MSVSKAQELLERSQNLRVELKEWERAFAAANNGQKAGRHDIKKNGSIALKYKEYTNLRGLLAGKDTALGASSLTETPSKKRKSTWDVSSNQIETPKRQKPHSTPSKSLHPAIIDPYDSPSVIRNLQLTPSYRTVIGPTPQRDGKVLGLFDLIDDDEDGSGSLTSKTQPFSGVSPNLHRTPRKPHLEQVVTPLRYGKTPTSTSKRFLLDMFVTPSKRKLMKEDVDEGATPAFLRRDHRRLQSPRYDEKGNLEIDSPVAARLPAKPPLRGLSSLIAGLRKMEEEEFDEEMDVLRELENGSSGAAKGSIVAGVAVNENQGKPSSKDDDLGEQTRENTQQPSLVGKDGKPLKVWKKRGQKRTTKRVNIRPSRAKPTPKPVNPSSLNEDPAGTIHTQNYDENASSTEPNTKKVKDNVVVKAAKKISASAHANFKRLKLRNRGSKGGGAGGRRFGRR